MRNATQGGFLELFVGVVIVSVDAALVVDFGKDILVWEVAGDSVVGATILSVATASALTLKLQLSGCTSTQRQRATVAASPRSAFAMGIHGFVFLVAQISAFTDQRSIYKEIGPGRRVALSKLAVEHFEETGQPLRIAVDVSIWLFQIQASKGAPILTGGSTVANVC